MAPAVARELSVSYGGFVVGGTTDRLLDSQTLNEKGYITSSVEFVFLIQKDDEADFASEISAVEAAFRAPRQDLVITQGAVTTLSLLHGSSSGFDSDPRVIKREDIGNTGRSRRYTVRIEFGMPADNVAVSGLRNSTVNVAFTPARRRTVTFSGTTTAIGGTDARAKHDALIDAFVASRLTAFGGTYELAEEPTTTENSTIKTMEFSRVYEEIIFNQVSLLDDPEIVRQTLSMRRRKVAPGDSPGANRLIEIDVSYSCWLDKEITQALVKKWDDAIKPFILQEVSSQLGFAFIAVTDESPDFDFVENRITATMVIMASDGSKIIEDRITTKDTQLPGAVVVPAWTGDPLQKYLYQGPETRQRTITRVVKVLGHIEPSPPLKGGGGGPFTSDLVAIVIQDEVEHTKLTMGLSPDQFDITEVTAVRTLEFFKPITTKTAIIRPEAR